MKRLHLYVVITVDRNDPDNASLTYQPPGQPEPGLVVVREQRLDDGERIVLSDGPVSWTCALGYLGSWPDSGDGGVRLTSDQLKLVDTIMAGLDAKRDFAARLRALLDELREHVDRTPQASLSDDLKHDIIHKIDTLEAAAR